VSLNILVVDDSATVRTVIRKSLRLAGIETATVLEAADGRQALATIATRQVDLVFCDITMPVMDGVAMVEHLKQDGRLPDLPVVMISSSGTEPTIDWLRELGVRAFLMKPFRPEDIRLVFDQVLKKVEE